MFKSAAGADGLLQPAFRQADAAGPGRQGPGPKPRPALVCEILEREDGLAIIVAYGTSRGPTRLHTGEFAITKRDNPAAYSVAGLSFDTKFDLRQIIALPWNEDFFGVPPRAPHGQNPKLESLHASMMRAAQAAFQAVQHRS
jgi:hypothetical protein